MPWDAQAVERVHASFAKQGAMRTLGAQLTRVEAGEVELCFDWSPTLTQQHGFIHAGLLSTAMDAACGFAAYSLMPADAGVLSIEFKTNLLAPAKGQRFRCVAQVLKPGRTIVVAEARLLAQDEGQEKLVSTMTCTLMCVQNRPGLQG